MAPSPAQQFQVGANVGETIGVSIASSKSADLGFVNNVAFTGFDIADVTASAGTPASGVTAQTLTFTASGTATTVSVGTGASAADIAASFNAEVAGARATATTGVRITLATFAGG